MMVERFFGTIPVEPGGSKFTVVMFKMHDARYKIQDTRYKMQDTRCKMQDARCQMQDARYRMQDAQCKRVYISAYNKCAQHLPWVPEVCRPAKRALDERRFNPPNIEAAHSRAQAEHSTGEPFYEIPSAPDLRRRSPILAPLESHLRPPEPRKTIMWLPRETAIPPDGPHSAKRYEPGRFLRSAEQK